MQRVSHWAVGAALAGHLAAGDTAVASDKTAVRWTPPGITSNQYESTPTFTPDGREMYYMQADPEFDEYSLLVSRCVDGRWSRPAPPPFAKALPIHDADPFVTADGKRLYFISSRPEPGKDADFDIWYVERKTGGWGEAKRLPEPVNSPAAELLPRLAPSGRLYFGSDRAGGFGGMDVYVATPHGAASWRVENLGQPVSTAASEYEVEVSRDERMLVVVADRGDRSHLYRFVEEGGRWVEKQRIPARPDVFQVGPVLSPKSDRLLFAQADGERSGELFLIDLASSVDRSWPPACPEAE